MSFLEQIKKLAQEVCVRENCVLYDLEFVSTGRRTLRVYIDRLPQGVSVDDCANVSQGLNLLLDVDDVIPGAAYDLEVSSPGLERKLKELWHFEQVVGKMIQLHAKEAAFEKEGKPLKILRGQLLGVESETRVLRVERQSEVWVVAFDEIAKAKVVFEMPVSTANKPVKKPLKKRV